MPFPLQQHRQSELPPLRRFFRRIKSAILQYDFVYRLWLRLKFGVYKSEPPQRLRLPNRALKNSAEWRDATAKARQLGLPLHRGAEKNWDHLAAVAAIVTHTSTSAYVLDGGAEFYSNVLPALFVQGYRHLYGINLSFTDAARRGPIQYLPGDITNSHFPNEVFDAATCMSVIEHGVPLSEYFREMHRILKPGGLLITSTDYYPTPIDTAGKVAHGSPVKIFTKEEIKNVLDQAIASGFELNDDVDLECNNRPVRWEQLDLEYTFIIFTLRKKSTSVVIDPDYVMPDDNRSNNSKSAE